MQTRLLRLLLLTGLVLTFAATARAELVRGTIESIEPAKATVNVKTAGGKVTAVRVSKKTGIRIDGKDATAPMLKVGQDVVVVTDSAGVATRITVRAAAANPAAGGATGQEIKLARHQFSFRVPAGWKVLKQDTEGLLTRVVLQKPAKAEAQPTIVIWAGHPFIQSAPGGDGLKEATVLGACALAAHRARHWSMGAPETAAPLKFLGGVRKIPVTYGETEFFSHSFTFKPCTGYGLSNVDRKGGPLSVGCASSPEEIDATRQVLESILGPLKQAGEPDR